MAERLAKVLGCPTAYFYAREDDLAELIMVFGQMSAKERRRLIAELRKRVS